MTGRTNARGWIAAIAIALGPLILPLDAPAAAAEPVDLTVMSFNIWYGATQTHGMDQVVEAIRRAGAGVSRRLAAPPRPLRGPDLSGRQLPMSDLGAVPRRGLI